MHINMKIKNSTLYSLIILIGAIAVIVEFYSRYFIHLGCIRNEHTKVLQYCIYFLVIYGAVRLRKQAKVRGDVS